ncbi:F-box protein At3g07870 [Hevea brasiliensis]|uniref:F-box protein At3g07870 n=1 Tax=Hevea brasiliensis TaxID=3981 RepID=UPI0025F7A987|nr:F-box protein At3g07870 [Hevea brasiliensis]
MESLPREIMLNILSRLPTPSLLNAKLVNRSWQNLAEDPILIDLHFTHMAANNTNPCLILHGDHPIQNQLYALYFYPNNSNVGLVKRISLPPIPDFDIAASCNGWLCLSNSSRDTFHLYNPFTSDFLELPNKSTHQNEDVCTVLGFGIQAETKEYKVLKISHGTKNVRGCRRICGYPQSKAEILTVGSPIWRSLGQISYNLVQSPSQIMVNGKLHWVNSPFIHPRRNNRLISFDLADEKFRMVPNPDSAGFERHGSHRLKLVTIGGCLSVVLNINYGSFEIWVMKEYGVRQSWTKEFNISSDLPRELEEEVVDPAFKISRMYRRSFTRVICSVKNGEILLQYKCRALLSYDPRQGTFKDIKIPGMPNMFEAVAHDGNLNGIDSLHIGM